MILVPQKQRRALVVDASVAANQTACKLALSLGHHLFDTLYHAVALHTPGAVLVTADRKYFDKAKTLGHIAYLPDLVH